MRIFLVFSWLIISLLFLTTSSRTEATGVDNLLDLLQGKDLITPEEAAGLRADPAIKESEQRLEKLERHIEALERRLEVSEQENARLRAEKPAIVPTSPQPDIKTLDQKVKVLEQRLAMGEEATAEITKKAPKFEAGSAGIRFSSSDGEHVLSLRGSVQTDGKFFMDDKDTDKNPPEGSNLTDRFELKQARIRFEGSLFKYFDFKIMPDFGGNSGTRLYDAYVDTHYFSFASLNVGKQKPPIILERLQGDNDFTFLERAYPTYLGPNRDVGIVLHGEFARPGYKTQYTGSHVNFKNLFSYQIGVFNGVGDNGPIDQQTDFDDNKEFAGRIWAHPFQYSGISLLDNLGIGVGSSWGQPHTRRMTNLPSPNGQNTIVDYSKLGSGVTSLTADGGDHTRVSPQAYWYYGPFGLLGEYVVSSQELLGKNASGENFIRQDNTAWQVQASYVVTGEDNTFQSVTPRNNFDPRNGGWGALQLSARWTELDIDDDTFAFLDPDKSVNHATTWTVGANWLLNKATRLMANYEETYFDGGAEGGGDRQTEKVFSTRLQLSF